MNDFNSLESATFRIREIDDEITTHIPELKRRHCTPRVMQEVDALLDTRNELSGIIGKLAFNEYERMMQ